MSPETPKGSRFTSEAYRKSFSVSQRFAKVRESQGSRFWENSIREVLIALKNSAAALANIFKKDFSELVSKYINKRLKRKEKKTLVHKKSSVFFS